MTQKQQWIAMASAAALAASGVASLAAASQSDSAPKGTASTARTEALPPQPVQAVRALNDPDGLIAPAPVLEALAPAGVKEPLLARQVSGRAVYLGRGTRNLICMGVHDPQTDRTVSTCQDPVTISQGMLWVGVGGDAEASPRIYGIAPDGVSEAKLTTADGQTEASEVVNNVYVGSMRQPFARVEWRSPSGDAADLRVPSRTSP